MRRWPRTPWNAPGPGDGYEEGNGSVHISVGEYLLVLTAAFAGATVQGTVGFGANLLAVPVVAIVVPDALPATLVLWVVPMVVAMARRERDGVDWSGVGWMSVGRLPGTALGAWVVSAVAEDTLSVMAGSAVLLGVAASVVSPAVPLTPVTKTAAGFTSGIMATTTSIGGPPMALLYQHEAGKVLRSTLAAGFVIGTATTLVGLVAAGAIEGWHIWLAIALAPSLAAGLFLSKRLVGRVDQLWLRPAVLTVAAVAALVAVGAGLA